jgi:hypothetical protein
VAVATRPLRFARVRRLALARLEISTAQLLGGIVAVSFLFRTLAGWLRVTPVYFPDEYIYGELGRSIAETGRPLVRGVQAAFPALLQPLLTAPAWLAGDVEVSYRLIQMIGAATMSLAAIPAFLLARRLGLGRGVALAAAAFAVAIPDLVYASWVVAEPVAYPLALAALAAGTLALVRPSPRAQLAFFGFTVLATFARVQFVVLPVCFLGSLVAMGLRERRLRGALREQALLLGLFALPLLALVAAGPSRALGYYRGVLDFELHPLALLRWMGSDATVLAYVSGWVLVPGAIIGLVLGIWRPRSRAELAFASFAPFFVLALLVEAAAYATSGGNRVQERYFFYALPVVVLAFALYGARGWPHRAPHALLAGALVTVSARLPLAGFTAADGTTNSPFLLATGYLERTLGSLSLASLGVAVTAAALSLVAVMVVFRSRHAFAVLFGLALAACLATSAAVVAVNHTNSEDVRSAIFPGTKTWVDDAGLDDVAFVLSPLGNRGFATEQLFWNRSVEELLVLPDASPLDAFHFDQAEIAADGSLVVAGRPLERPLLVDGYGATLRFRGARTVARSAVFRLVRPEGRPRLALYVPGRYWDGWLALNGSIRVWPEPGEPLAGRLTLVFESPSDAPAAKVQLALPGSARRVISLPSGSRRPVTLSVCSTASWRADFAAPFTGTVGDRLVSVHATEPRYLPDPSACA